MNSILDHHSDSAPAVTAAPSPNPQLDRKIQELLSLAERLCQLRQRLDAEGRSLPGFFLDPYKPALEFTRLHAGHLATLFGSGGWQRKANSRAHFDWVKTLPDGLHLRIIECEEIAAPATTVPSTAFALATHP